MSTRGAESSYLRRIVIDAVPDWVEPMAATPSRERYSGAGAARAVTRERA